MTAATRVSNQQPPALCMGKAVRYQLQTSINGGVDALDLTPAVMAGQIDQIQGVYIDAYDCTAAVTLTTSVGQRIVVAAGEQLWSPVLQPNPPRFTFACDATSPDAVVFLTNFAVPFGNLSAAANIDAAIEAWLNSLPTSLPATAGQWWINGGVLSRS